MDVSAVVLNKLISESNLECWAKLKLAFLDPAYSSIYTLINRHYDKYSAIPTFDELEATSRDTSAEKMIAAIKLADEVDVSIEVALDALIDLYTQNTTIALLDKFIDKLPLYDTAEVKENLSSIVLTLDEKTLKTEGVYSMSEIMVFVRPDALAKNTVFLGLNNTFDSVVHCARQELILIGGKRGAGKSLISSNIMINQYEAGNTSVYFTIEMVAHETLQRNMSILSNVNHQNIKNGTLSDAELLSVVRARAGMFEDADPLVKEFIKDRDQFKFEEALVKQCKLKDNNQMIIIDDRALNLSSLDLHLGKLKSRFGDKLTVAVVDYLNQIVVEGGSNQFDWQPQIVVSKKLKELARKYDLLMVSPYQIDDKGEARFAKGILDAADIALVLEANSKEDNAISFETTKIRGARDMKFTSGMNWDTLRISPQSVEKPIKEDKDSKKHKKHKDASGEVATDMPPWEG